MPKRILADEPRRWLTTSDVAKLLGVTARWVRWLARHHELACDMTESGIRIFRRDDVRHLLIARTEARARSRPAQLQAVRVRMLKAGYEPRQMNFLHRLTLVHSGAGSERPDPEAEVKRARSGADVIRSEKLRYVNRKAGAR